MEGSSSEGGGSPPRRFRFLADRVARTVTQITADVGKTIGRTALSAGELLGDMELRKKGTAFVVREASKGLKGIQQGIGTAAGTIGRTIQSGAYGISQGPRHVQAVLERIQQRIQEQRLSEMLEMHRNKPVDVQMGRQLYEDAPQELRTRLWCVLLESPDLGEVFRPLCDPQAAIPSGSSPMGQRSDRERETPKHPEEESPKNDPMDPLQNEECASPADGTLIPMEDTNPEGETSGGGSIEAVPRLEGEISSSNDRQIDGKPDTHLSGDVLVNSVIKKIDRLNVSVESDEERGRGGPEEGGDNEDGSSTNPTGSSSSKFEQVSNQGEDEWELVGSVSGKSRALRRNPGSQSSEPVMSPHTIGVQVLNAAMLDIEWPLPTEPPEDSRYALLCQITVGQDEVDDIINRDIHRTFPEHPHFNFEQGKRALFNVLKAYSLHDLEVAYCQGMAFVAGVLLLYLPEEFAFRVFCRLMGKEGMNLRRLYLPGLHCLKRELCKLEWLLEKHLPRLHKHLQDHGIPAVLYASQWLMTAFACPFPPSFVARVIDIMLIENNDGCMQRAAFAVLAECEEEILALDDFEDILTYLKVQPMQWSSNTTRQILDSSLRSAITDEEIEKAGMAIAEEEASTSRPENSPFTRMGSGQNMQSASNQSGGGADGNVGGSRSGGNKEGGDGLEDELEKQRQEMASEELKVLLSMDMLWDAGESGAELSGRQIDGQEPANQS
ncbi:hypothetical protein BSKO_09676 [Bryopsis sp. KO-2023]|nr:hypothetical protein BSKO_09676 [Bryopsis sp. KO-2023]